MSCDDAQAAISARADGEPVDEGALDRHLARCGHCQSFAATVQQVRRELRITGVGEGIDVSERVLAEVGTGPAPPSEADRYRRSRHWQAAAAVAAVAATVLAVALWAGDATRSTVVAGRSPATTGTAPGAAPASSVSAASDLAVVWTADRLDTGLVEALDPLAAEMTIVRRETVGLTASWDEHGDPVDDPEAGWSVPLDVIAVDTAGYGPLLGGEALTDLGPGEAVLGSTSARLRELGPGARLAFGAVELDVVGVVGDQAVGAAEVAVSTGTGELLGVTTDRYAIVRAHGPPDTLEAELDDTTESEPPFRAHLTSDTPYLRNSDAVLPQTEIKETFGEFATRPRGDSFEVDSTWFAGNIVTTELPLVGQVTCHQAVVPALRAVLAELDEAGLDGVITPERFQGCWNPRNIRATGDLSRHSWGVAIDIRTDEIEPAVISDQIRPAFEAHGLTWGGTWLTSDDGHFEYVAPDR